jgi:serine phosphatase RsbU (regulator of sigma subunit)
VGVGSVSKLNAAGGIPVGIDGEAPYESRTEPFEPGDMLMLCSDGVIEQRNRAGEEFTADRLEGLLQRDGASLTTGALLDAVRAFADREALDDDFTACIVRRAEEEA